VDGPQTQPAFYLPFYVCFILRRLSHESPSELGGLSGKCMQGTLRGSAWGAVV